MKLNTHHITYEPEVTVELKWQDHKVISTWQRTKATPEQYALLTNYVHSVAHEWNRMRAELETGLDLRVKKPKEG